MKTDEIKFKTKEISREFLIMNLGIIALGVILTVYPDESKDLICRVLACALCVWGLFKIFEYIKLKNNEIFGSFSLVQGCSLLVFGVYIMIRPSLLAGFVLTAMSIILFIGGILKLQYALELSNMNSKGWVAQAIAAVIMIVTSVISFADPFNASNVLMIFIGVSLIADGLWDIFTLFYLKRLIKKAKQSFVKSSGKKDKKKDTSIYVNAEAEDADDYDDGFDD